MGVFRRREVGGSLGIIFYFLISRVMFFKRLSQLACCGLLLCAALAGAAEYTVTAEYRAELGSATFVNTTVNTGVCAVQPSYCVPGSSTSTIGSFKTPISAISENGFVKLETRVNPRMGPYFMAPGEFRSVTLTNEATGSTRTVKFRVAGFGGTYILSQPVSGGHEGHREIWYDSVTGYSGWDHAPPPCYLARMGSYTNTDFNFFWRYPYGTSACYKNIFFDVPGPFRYKDFEFSYLMQMPSPLDMDAGVYKGNLTYDVGSGRDFDFGDKMIPSDNVITVNFEFTVKAALKVDFPPGSNRAILQPLRGWQAWLNSGRNPPALSASHGFKISGSGPFKVYLRCDIQMGLSCGIQGQGVAAKGILVAPVDIAVTFPPGIVQTPGNRPAIKAPLKSGVANAATFNISGLQKSQSATIHYDVAAEQTALMVESPGSTYQGIVTLIFDAVI